MMRLNQLHSLHRYLLQGDGSGGSDVAVYITFPPNVRTAHPKPSTPQDDTEALVVQ